MPISWQPSRRRYVAEAAHPLRAAAMVNKATPSSFRRGRLACCMLELCRTPTRCCNLNHAEWLQNERAFRPSPTFRRMVCLTIALTLVPCCGSLVAALCAHRRISDNVTRQRPPAHGSHFSIRAPLATTHTVTGSSLRAAYDAALHVRMR